eukprot:426338_1
MRAVATSSKKPAFMYLLRDAEDLDYDPFDSFDEYINNSDSFHWFRDMNVFSSLSAFELKRPSIDKNARGLNFHTLQENRELISPLIKVTTQICSTSSRFAENMFILKQQICHINKSTWNTTMQYVMDNDILKLFIVPRKRTQKRRRDMVFAACEFDWDHKILDKKFNEQMKKMHEIVNDIDQLVVYRLNTTKQEIYERIKGANFDIEEKDEEQVINDLENMGKYNAWEIFCIQVLDLATKEVVQMQKRKLHAIQQEKLIQDKDYKATMIEKTMDILKEDQKKYFDYLHELNSSMSQVDFSAFFIECKGKVRKGIYRKYICEHDLSLPLEPVCICGESLKARKKK